MFGLIRKKKLESLLVEFKERYDDSTVYDPLFDDDRRTEEEVSLGRTEKRYFYNGNMNAVIVLASEFGIDIANVGIKAG